MRNVVRWTKTVHLQCFYKVFSMEGRRKKLWKISQVNNANSAVYKNNILNRRKMLNDRYSARPKCFIWIAVWQYWLSNGNKHHKIFLLVGCAKWGVKSPQLKGNRTLQTTPMWRESHSEIFSHRLGSKDLVLQSSFQNQEPVVLLIWNLCISGHGMVYNNSECYLHGQFIPKVFV